MDWGIVGSLASLVIAIWQFWHGRRLSRIEEQLKQLQLHERRDRAELALNVAVTTRIFETVKGRILETRVTVSNDSCRRWAIPAIYVSGRGMGVEGHSPSYFTEEDFGGLPYADDLSKPYNIARRRDSIVEITPGEIEEFVRIDRLPENFTRVNPVVFINVEVFGASDTLLGMAYDVEKAVLVPGTERVDWIKFISGDDNRRHYYHLFKLWPLSKPATSELRPGARYLTVESGEPDLVNTKRFRVVLDSIRVWKRCLTVHIERNSIEGS